MGQHKYNPTVQLVKEGKLPPKEPKMGKRATERLLREEMTRLLYEKLSPKFKSSEQEKHD